MNTRRASLPLAALSLVLVCGASQAAVTGSQRIEPSVIRLGEAARLTISENGDAAVTPPMVAGLEFVATSQSQRMESVNGVSSTTTSVTYQVVPQQAGVFTIPSELPGAQPLVLTVNPAGRGSAQNGLTPAPGNGQPSSSSAPAGATQLSADGSAFVRLRLAKHDLYVGETVPVDVQVGMRDGLVASLNGLPTLNGDAFTLAKLSSEPVRTEEVVNGKPFTVLSWHSTLAAVKPGKLSLTIETPLTVRMRTAARPDAGFLDDAGLGDLFNDPMFQNFFGASTEKDVTVASTPTTFSVMPLPTQGQPADFSGAVGHFSVSASVSNDATALGDPVTLRMRVSGEGSFDRVSSPMLKAAPDWKTYAPTAAFKAEDDSGYRGEKTFEQPLIATRAGTDAIPEIGFSWFDPTTKRYVEAHTAPLSVSVVAPASAAGSAVTAQLTSPAQQAGASAKNFPPGDELQADHAVTGRGSATLLPHFYQPAYMAVPSALLVALSGGWFLIRRRERRQAAGAGRAAASDLEAYENDMREAVASRDEELFFKSARAALKISLAQRWNCPANSVTRENVEARLGSASDAARIFELADEKAYSGIRERTMNLVQWEALMRRQLSGEALT